MSRVLWRVRQLTLARGLKRLSTSWRESGELVTLAYAAPIFAVLGLGGLDLVRQSQLDLPAGSLYLGLCTLALALHAWGLLRRGHPLELHATDSALLQTPLPAGQVLLWPLVRALGLPLAAGVAGAVLTYTTTPLGWLALSLPLSASGSVVLAALARDARWSNWTAGQWAALLALLPLLGLLYPSLLVPATLAALAASSWLWFRRWQHAPNPRAVRDMQFSGLVQTAHRLHIPPPKTHPEARLTRPGLRPALQGTGAFQALLWRSLLHLTRHTWRLPIGVLLGVGVPLLMPASLSLNPLATGGLLLLAAVLQLVLSLRGPGAPPSVPVDRAPARLARTLPAAVALGVLAGCVAVPTVLLSSSAAVLVPTAALLPWAALSLSVWADSGDWLAQGQAAQVNLGLAFLPLLTAYLGAASPLPWLAPLLLLLLGLAPYAAWLTGTFLGWRRQRKTGLAPARQP